MTEIILASPVVKIEPSGLWLMACTDGSEHDIPELAWKCLNCNEFITPAGRGFQYELDKADGNTLREWLANIEKWQANSDSLRRDGSDLYNTASRAAMRIKARLMAVRNV